VRVKSKPKPKLKLKLKLTLALTLALALALALALVPSSQHAPPRQTCRRRCTEVFQAPSLLLPPASETPWPFAAGGPATLTGHVLASRTSSHGRRSVSSRVLRLLPKKKRSHVRIISLNCPVCRRGHGTQAPAFSCLVGQSAQFCSLSRPCALTVWAASQPTSRFTATG
jgi:hypothetical protein